MVAVETGPAIAVDPAADVVSAVRDGAGSIGPVRDGAVVIDAVEPLESAGGGGGSDMIGTCAAQPYVQEAERISSCSSPEEGSNVWVLLKDVGHYLKVLVAMPTVVERFVDWTVSWLPMYGDAKLLVVIYLWHPSTRGAGHVYDRFLHPLVAWHEADIDRGLLELKARARDVTASQLKAVAAIGPVWLVEGARCVSSQMQAVRSGREGATH
ncbi:receptor expression-enhancing protein 3-like [Triticum urartu]|uniref:receptor expression-enhancing protein 3-like n=1 Tax=Triticum urartu TaxID=4572 RepID=UPI00204371A4|nr:receptor expression-enhancing protein 3-like [Triticum urartu]